MKFNGTQIRKLRIEKKWSLKALAEALGYRHFQSLTNVEGNRVDMANDKQRLLTKILELTPDEIRFLKQS